MNQKEFYYIKINEEENKIYSIGLSFSEFIQGVSVKPKNVLLIKGDFYESDFNFHTQFEYVTEKSIDKLYNDNVYNYGDFCWVDFNSIESVNNLTSLEIAELLYAGHKFRALDGAFSNRIKNQYLYMAHDDEYTTVVYMKNLADYKRVIASKIISELKGRRKSMSNISQEIVEEIYCMAKQGVLIDFNNVYRGKNYVGVRVYRLGDLLGYDSIEKQLLRKKNCSKCYINLEYKNKRFFTY